MKLVTKFQRYHNKFALCLQINNLEHSELLSNKTVSMKYVNKSIVYNTYRYTGHESCVELVRIVSCCRVNMFDKTPTNTMLHQLGRWNSINNLNVR